MSDMNFILVNGRATSDYPAQSTFCNHNGNSVIDFVWVNQYMLPLVVDLHISPVITGSDHFPIVIDVKIGNDNVITSGTNSILTTDKYK